jgi:uracil phosphoribosyltransferase
LSFQTVEHPLIRHYLGIIRDKSTKQEAFESGISRIASLMVAEVTRHLETQTKSIITPLEAMDVRKIRYKIVLVPILRAGLGMVPGFHHVLPNSTVAHLGLYRDEATLEPVVYYKKLPPDLNNHDLIVLDPMLATGGTACAAIDYLKVLEPRSIRFACILAAPEGVEQFTKSHPDVPAYGAAVDRQLNEKGYILPGLGDAGDRIFGTEF